MAWDASLLLLQLVATSALTGLIWIIQVVHYPAFKFVPDQDFSDFCGFHQHRISFVVIPLMFLELGLGLWWAYADFQAYSAAGLVLIVLIWLSTFLLSVPCHQKLSRAWDPMFLARLISTNWIRTLAWSARCLLLFVYWVRLNPAS